MRKFASTLLLVITAAAVASSASADDQIKRRLLSPFGTSDRLGVDAVGETLLSATDRKELSYWLHQQDLIAKVASEQNSQNHMFALGYGVKGLGRAIEAGGGAAGDMLKNPLAGGAMTISGAVVGGYVGDYGDKLIRDAGQLAAARVAIFLHQEYGNFILKNGQVNSERLRNFGQENLGRALRDPNFIEKVGDFALMADFKSQITIDMLGVILKDNKALQLSVGRIDKQLQGLNEGYREVKTLQFQTLDRLTAQGQALGSIEGKVDNATVLISTLVSSNLPPRQILALYEAGALSLDVKTVLAMEKSASASELRADFERSASVFQSAATAMDALGVDPELVRATAGIGNLLASGGGLAAAIAIGEPLSIFTSSAGFLGSLKSVFGSVREDPTQAALRAIFKELRSLSEQIQRNHRQQMEALHRIANKLQDVEDTLNRRFAELGLDIAHVLQDTRELLYEDVRVCERLADEFQLDETQALMHKGLIGFAIWYETDNRAADFARCLNGLISRQRVVSERDFSGMLRADSIEEIQAGANASARRSAVRRTEQRILQPTVDYTRMLVGEDEGASIAKKIFAPAVTLCDALRIYGDPKTAGCSESSSENWPSSRLAYSQYNPGQGSLLSASTALLMARFTRTVAPWNGILIERTTGATARTISEKEAHQLSRRAASRRTRHLLALRNAVDALDLNIAQAQVLAGTPIVSKAADLLDTRIIPAYAKARRLNQPADINKMLIANDPPAALPGPNCVSASVEWNTLCLMETNPTFARNVIRLFIAKRLHRKGASFEDWRKAVRSPFSGRMQELIGNDVMIADAVATLKDKSSLGIWAFELPRVYSDPDIKRPAEDSGLAASCWTPGVVTPPLNEKREFDENADYYINQASSRCHIVDPFTSNEFELIAHATSSFQELLTERALTVGLLHELCNSNKYYPAAYCLIRDQRPQQENLISFAR
jgi:hypothetical protein